MSETEGRGEGEGEGGRGTGDGGQETPLPPTSPPRTTPPPLQWNNFVNTVKTRPIDVALWLTRLITIGFGVFYLIPLPIFGNASGFYYKALMAGAATSALRLHQRLPPFSFTQMFFAQLMLEDSCHYLLYCVIFLFSAPITLALLPVLLFAMLHFASFSLTLLDALGRNSAWIGRVLISIVELQTVTILRLAAGAEIITFVFTVAYALTGRSSILTPFMYYRFLTLRYASRRNHYTRTMFYEIRIQLDHLINSPKCPAAVGNIVRRAISLVIRFAPPVPPPAN